MFALWRMRHVHENKIQDVYEIAEKTPQQYSNCFSNSGKDSSKN